MAHLRYYRAERDRWDHVILMLPDVCGTPNLMPTADTYRSLIEDTFPAQLRNKLAALEAETFAPQSEAAIKVHNFNEAKAAAAVAAATANETATTEEKPSEDTKQEATSAEPMDATTAEQSTDADTSTGQEASTAEVCR